MKTGIEIAGEHFTPTQLEIVTLAGRFHDCGYINTYVNQEGISKARTPSFLVISFRGLGGRSPG